MTDRKWMRGAAALYAVAWLVVVPTIVTAQDSIDLERFLELVEQNSLQLQNSRTDRELADVQERLVRSQVYPTVVGQLEYTRNVLDIEQEVPAYVDTDGDPLIPGTGLYQVQTEPFDINADNDYTVGFSVQQRVFDLAVFRALEASRRYTDLTGRIYEASRQAILTEAKRLYFQTVLLQEVVAVRRSSEEIAYENYQETQRRGEAGLVSPLEVLQAEVNWEITRPDTTQAERNLQVALQNVRNFAGIDANREIRLTESLDRFPALPTFEGAYDRRFDRPDYQAILNRRTLQEINITAERAAFYPSVSASLSYGWQASDDGVDLSGGVDSLSAGLAVTIPIFYGGSRFARMDQARLELEKAITDQTIQDDTIYTQLETIRLRLVEAEQRIRSAEQTRATAERAFTISETAVASGLATQLELKDARVNLERTQLNYVSAVFDYLSAYFDWQLATGEGDRLP